MPDLSESVAELEKAFGADPLALIRRLEVALPSASARGASASEFLATSGLSPETVRAALEIKRIAGQVNVMVHATGILASLPYLLQAGEIVESASLGAGNTGKDFDLVTNLRVAEFKFIAWRGGAESIRQNHVFKDFLKLLWDQSGKRRQLLLTGTTEALAFLHGGRALTSVLSRDGRLQARFTAAYGHRFVRVGEFFERYGGEVEIIDLRKLVPVFAAAPIPSETDISADEL